MSLIATAYLCIAFLPFAGLSANVWLGLIGLPLGLCAAKRLQSKRETHEIIPTQRWMFMSFCLEAFECGIGLLIWLFLNITINSCQSTYRSQEAITNTIASSSHMSLGFLGHRGSGLFAQSQIKSRYYILFFVVWCEVPPPTCFWPQNKLTKLDKIKPLQP